MDKHAEQGMVVRQRATDDSYAAAVIRFERSAEARQRRSAIRAEIDRIIKPWEDAILAAESAGAQVKRVRMPSDIHERLQELHDRFCAEQGMSKLDVMTLYDLPIDIVPRGTLRRK